MKKEKSQKVLLSGIAMVVLFILWTVAISLIDVQPIGPQNSSVGNLERLYPQPDRCAYGNIYRYGLVRTDTALLYFGICVAWTYTAY